MKSRNGFVIVKVNPQNIPQFLVSATNPAFAKWTEEYPDANTFGGIAAAKRAIAALLPYTIQTLAIYGNYGFEDEFIANPQTQTGIIADN